VAAPDERAPRPGRRRERLNARSIVKSGSDSPGVRAINAPYAGSRRLQVQSDVSRRSRQGELAGHVAEFRWYCLPVPMYSRPRCHSRVGAFQMAAREGGKACVRFWSSGFPRNSSMGVALPAPLAGDDRMPPAASKGAAGIRGVASSSSSEERQYSVRRNYSGVVIVRWVFHRPRRKVLSVAASSRRRAR